MFNIIANPHHSMQKQKNTKRKKGQCRAFTPNPSSTVRGPFHAFNSLKDNDIAN